MRPYKKIAVVTGILSFTLLGIAATRPTGDEDPPYKNLKVLSKKIKEDELERVMYSFESQLGVTCFYCHVRKKDNQGIDFATDEKKEKVMAREMLKMTLHLNNKYFQAKVDRRTNGSAVIWCKTCHQGFPRPLNRPMKGSRF